MTCGYYRTSSPVTALPMIMRWISEVQSVVGRRARPGEHAAAAASSRSTQRLSRPASSSRATNALIRPNGKGGLARGCQWPAGPILDARRIRSQTVIALSLLHAAISLPRCATRHRRHVMTRVGMVRIGGVQHKGGSARWVIGS